MARLELKIDWLNFTFPCGQMEGFLELLRPWLGEIVWREYGVHSYKFSGVWESQACLAWSAGRDEAFCSLNAMSWDLLPDGDKLNFLRMACDLGAKFSRVDCALNDFDRVASMDQIHEAAEAYNFTGFQYTDAHRPRKGRVLVGDSRTFGKVGKAGSGKYLIVYDKNLESDGELDCIRYEARFYKEFADLVVRNFAESDDESELVRKIGRAVGGVIDFRVRGDEKNVSRMPRIDWWSRILEEIGCAKVTIPQVVPTLQRFAEWFGRALAPSLARVRDVAEHCGTDFYGVFHALLNAAEIDGDPRRRGARELGIDLRAAWLPDWVGVG